MVVPGLGASSLIASTLGIFGSGIWMIPLLLGTISYYRYDRVDPESRPIDQPNLHPEYDFIVIGGGSAGAVVANRLSENPKHTVLLIEAGPDENEVTDVPSLSAYLQLSNFDWSYKTEPSNTACLGMVNNRCNWPRGKVLGGSSVLNYMVYVRGNKNDFNHWAEMGNSGWDYKSVLPYFLKSEDNRNPYLAKSPYHASGGYLTVQEAPWHTPLVAAFVEAGTELGYENRDINSDKQTGYMIAQGTIRRGSRCSTAKAFLRPIRLRPNFHLALNTFVTKIEIDPRTKRAWGVEFVRHNRKQVIRAKREVILSAGAINSPQLLMLSGVGPRDHLEAMGIPVIKDLPVGNNLMDHLGFGGLTFIVDKPVAILQNRIQAATATTEYVLNERGKLKFFKNDKLSLICCRFILRFAFYLQWNIRKGPMTVLGGLEGIAFVNTPYANHSKDWPDIQFHMAPASLNSDGGVQVRKILGLKQDLYNEMWAPIHDVYTWTIMPLLLRPRSRGWVRLQSKNPFVAPTMNPNYYEDPIDILTMIEGAKIALKTANAKVFKQFGSRLYQRPLPNCKHFKFLSDEYLECGIRTISMTIYHQSGTAKMGPAYDPEAVVDPRLKVYGIQGLRVVDASIMPQIVSGNTNAAVIMIGEKGSDLIKEDWRQVS